MTGLHTGLKRAVVAEALRPAVAKGSALVTDGPAASRLRVNKHPIMTLYRRSKKWPQARRVFGRWAGG